MKVTNINPKNFHVSQVKFYLILLPISIIMILPIIYIFSQALKPIDELILFPPRFFVSKPTMRNFQMLLNASSEGGIPLSRYIFNSVISVVATVGLTLLVSVMAGYALSKKNFKANKVFFKVNQSALMFVPIAVAIPSFIVVSNLGIANTFFAHILPLVAMPVGLFLLKQFIDQLPNDIIEAARIDGANDFQIVIRVIMPLIKSAIATVAILTFQISWANMSTSELYIDAEGMKTFAFFMGTLISRVDESIAGQGIAAAAGLIMFLPNLIIFIFLQSKVMDTMAHSGVK
ncbi:MAG: carbohydrate ABC transporter permease [Acholeplasmataceae bacterium]|nr:carbohydrate ABC transporter permease [Acholeplasmataceae bacterium]